MLILLLHKEEHSLKFEVNLVSCLFTYLHTERILLVLDSALDK